ncbi:MAG: hypothetical protein JWQ11_2554 [Rhizobacter sp.]|nr:hypothetical protein [Rhizobacter sp.]
MEIVRRPIVFRFPVCPKPAVCAVSGVFVQNLAQNLAQSLAKNLAQNLAQNGVMNGRLNRPWSGPSMAAVRPPAFTRPEQSHPLSGLNLKGINRKVIGAGVSGEVCRFTINGQNYIVKSMNGEAERTMFEKEVFAFRKLKPHDNICAPLAFANVNGKPSMLFADHTLPTTSIATRAASLPPNDQLAVMEVYARDLLRGLGAMHDEEIAHGDIKQANTVFNPKTLQFEIIDLGHSTVASASDSRTGGQVLRRRSGHSGDPGYTSPELKNPLLGNKKLTAQGTLQSIDVFAVGRILQDWLANADKRFEQVHGSKPSVEMAAGNPDVAKWMERRKRLGDVARQMLKKDPGERPVVDAALEALTPTSPADRMEGRKVLGQLAAAEKAEKARKSAEAMKSAQAGK